METQKPGQARRSEGLKVSDLVRSAFLSLAAAALFLFTLVHIHEALSLPGVMAFDRAVQDNLHRHAAPAFTCLARILSLIGSPETLYVTIPLAAVILWSRRRRRDAVRLLIAMAGAGTLETAIKLHYRRLRPSVPWALVHERSFSFPSGHAVLAAALYGCIVWLAWKRLGSAWRRVTLATACLALAAAIGLSRIYLGAHYPSDVLTGYLVGAGWLLLLIASDRQVAHCPPVSTAVRQDTPGTGTGSAE